MKYFLAIDQGTHASRAVLYDQEGLLITSCMQEIALTRKRAGVVEQDASEILSSIKTVVRRLLQSLPAAQRNHISACGLATQRSTIVACDSQGKPFSPALSWQDTRAQSYLDGLSMIQIDTIQEISGLPVSAHYGASKMQWLLQQVNATYSGKLSDVYLAPLVSFLLFNLLPSAVYCVDHSNAQRTQLMDIKTLDWSQSLMRIFSVPKTYLPKCMPVCTHYGELMDSGIPVMAVSGDQNAAVLANGESSNNTALINIGTGAFVMRFLPEFTSSKKQLTSIAYSNEEQVRYLREGTINGAGSALAWFEQEWELENDWQRELPKWLDEIQQPPLFINTVGGLGSPYWTGHIASQFIGNNTDDMTHCAVAVVESIVFLLQDNIVLMQQESAIKALKVSGGLSQLNGLCQKLANLTQLPVSRLQHPEATARGIAWLAAGKPLSWEAQLHSDDIFTPHEDQSLNNRYKAFHSWIAKRMI